MAVARPIPKLRGEEQVYFSEAKAGRLVYQFCMDCGTNIFYPRSVCTSCMSESLEYRPSSGKGVIYSFTTLHLPGHPAFKDEVPYTVVLVTLEEGVRVLADLADCGPDEVHVDMPVEVFFEDVNEEFTVPRFRPRAN